ncbi:hypothetical protein FQA39_LY08830 [Lamprigera yunnana]|nr:hypothetical protein FQA39_LY08830 [Lamprigera yunnana]
MCDARASYNAQAPLRHVLSEAARKIVWNNYKYFKSINSGNVLDIVVQATGVSKSTVIHILKQCRAIECGEKITFANATPTPKLSPKSSIVKQIEDVIEAMKKCGQYNIIANEFRGRNPRPMSAPTDVTNKASSQSLINNGDLYGYSLKRLGPTDSEVTVLRVKQKSLQNNTYENKWNLNDEAVPGDGTHLGESPSLVNLVTLIDRPMSCSLIEERCEYLVPLSSWEPSDFPFLWREETKSRLHILKSSKVRLSW